MASIPDRHSNIVSSENIPNTNLFETNPTPTNSAVYVKELANISLSRAYVSRSPTPSPSSNTTTSPVTAVKRSPTPKLCVKSSHTRTTPIALASPSVEILFAILETLAHQPGPLSSPNLYLTLFSLVAMPAFISLTSATYTSTPRLTSLNTPASTSPTSPKNSSKNTALPTKHVMVGSTSRFAKESTAFHRPANLPTTS